MIHITIATDEHLERIYEIEQEAISPSWSREALFDEMNKDDSFFVVAADNTKELSPCVATGNTTEPSPCVSPYVAGFAILRRVGDDGELLQIAVDKSARRHGVGDLLMKSTLDYSEENALNSVFLEVRSSNIAAICLYKKHGFKHVRIRKDYYDNPVEDALVMVKIPANKRSVIFE